MQKHGLHVLPTNYWEPVPLVEDALKQTSELRLIAPNFLLTPDGLRIAEMVDNGGAKYALDQLRPAVTQMFGGLDAYAYIDINRTYTPRRIVEIGAGYSTSIALQSTGDECSITAIEPYPSEFLVDLAEKQKRINLIRERIQDFSDAQMTVFDELEPSDILFIDSSHVCTIGGDLPAIFCLILPRIRPGVIVHIHDVTYPYEYPRNLINKLRFYNELYLISTLLNHGAYEFLFGSYHFLISRNAWLVPTAAPFNGGMSLWLRRQAETK
jgi:hypothetical protein